MLINGQATITSNILISGNSTLNNTSINSSLYVSGISILNDIFIRIYLGSLHEETGPLRNSDSTFQVKPVKYITK